MTWMKQRARWVSDHLTGAGAVIVALVLALLGIVGNLTLARDLFGVQIGTTVVVGIGFVVLVGNLLYRANRRATDAEKERDDLRTQLDAKPDPAAERRLFLRLHDFGVNDVLPYFEMHLERMREQVPIGKGVFEAWIAKSAEAVEEYRPEHALAFREALVPPRRGGGVGGIVIVKDEDGNDRWVSMDEAREYQDLVKQACAVLARIVQDA